MLSLKERIELLENDLKASPPAFTMTADLPFAIFRYDPQHPDEDEWRMRKEIQYLCVRVQNATNRKVHTISLANLFWRSIKESEGIQTIVDMEKEKGFEAAQRQVGDYLSDRDWCPLPNLLKDAMQEMNPQLDLVFLTRCSVFAPNTYHISALLEQLMGKTQVPAVLFYPGSWHGSLNYMNMRNEEQPLGSYRVKIYGREA